MQATPTKNNQPMRAADFPNLAAALDYAALGQTGSNFYTGRGELYAVLPYAELRVQALQLARRLCGLNAARGARVAIVADTHPDFLRFFFACQYAGLVPVPLPIPLNPGGHAAYVKHTRAMVQSCQASMAMAPADYSGLLDEVVEGLGLAFVGSPEAFDALPQQEGELQPMQADELAYLQYTSGSTRFPRGVMITQRQVLSNLAGIITEGMEMRPTDRCVSWLPFYHDLGLVGLVLVPLASQRTVDYLGTREFAMRPKQWLKLMSRNKATISCSPPFGFELCNRRLREGEAEQFDLSAWRVAGLGAEMIRPQVLNEFAETLAPSGFDRKAFLPGYGMAECSLAVSFTPVSKGLLVDRVDADLLGTNGLAQPVEQDAPIERVSEFVNCGVPMSTFEVEVRDASGKVVPERHIGVIHVRAASVMSGYFNEPGITAQTLSPDGWLDTGDIGYQTAAGIFITGRKKDLIIINGRNIWPQDLEQIAEQQPELRPGDALAFAVPGAGGTDKVVMVVQSREKDAEQLAELSKRLHGLVLGETGVDCHIDLVPLHTLPRTSSGKLSRSKARLNYIDAHRVGQHGDQAEVAGLPLKQVG
ncbi:MAG: fatty acyl-AMP ligase [Proteobacteria bacterium]|nr:fatty acyl-AMP ligase [Pseudomonadota bacterium]